MGLLKSTISDARAGKSGKTLAPEFSSGASAKTLSKTPAMHNQMQTGQTGPGPAKGISQAMHPVKPSHDAFQSKHFSPVDLSPDNLSDKSNQIDKKKLASNKTATVNQSKNKLSDFRSPQDIRQQSEHKTTLPTYETKINKDDLLTALPSMPDKNTIITDVSNQKIPGQNTSGKDNFSDKEYLMNASVEARNKFAAKTIQQKKILSQGVTNNQSVIQPDSVDKSVASNLESPGYKKTPKAASVYPEVSNLLIKANETDQQVAADEIQSTHIPLTHKQSQQSDLLDYHDDSRHSSSSPKERINPEQINTNRDDSYSHRAIAPSKPDIETQESLPLQYSEASVLQAENSINEINDQQSDVQKQMQRFKTEQAELHSELNVQPSVAAVQAQVIDNYSIANNQLRNIANNHVNSSAAPAKSAEVKIGQVDVFIESPNRSETRHVSASRHSSSMASRYYLRRL